MNEPNEQTQATLEQSQSGENLIEFDSLDAMFASWQEE